MPISAMLKPDNRMFFVTTGSLRLKKSWDPTG
jgi:hypothetical protein